MEEERRDGITLAEVMNAVKRQIWLVLAITLAGTLVISLVFGLFLNPRKAEYSMSYNLIYPSDEDARYPDGSPFYDFDLVSAGFLEEAKKSDEGFAGLNTELMLRDNDVRLSKKQMETGRDIYTITVKASYFSSKEQAEEFIRALAQVPVSRIVANAQTMDYTLDPEVFASASFEEKIGLLSELKETLLKACDGWIDLYGATYSVDGRTLGNYRSALYVVYGESTKEIIEAEFATNGYDGLDIAAHATLADAIKTRQEALQEEFDLNNLIIVSLGGRPVEMSGGNAVSLYAATEQDSEKEEENGDAQTTVIVNQKDNMDSAEMIAFYTKRNAQIKYQLNTSLTEDNVNGFMTRLDGQFGELQDAAQTASAVASSVYTKNTAISFHAQKAQTSGGTSLVLIVICSLVVWFIVAVVVAVFLDGKKRQRGGTGAPAQQSEKEQTDEQDPEGSPSTKPDN